MIASTSIQGHCCRLPVQKSTAFTAVRVLDVQLCCEEVVNLVESDWSRQTQLQRLQELIEICPSDSMLATFTCELIAKVMSIRQPLNGLKRDSSEVTTGTVLSLAILSIVTVAFRARKQRDQQQAVPRPPWDP
jgi:hypothetical protein